MKGTQLNETSACCCTSTLAGEKNSRWEEKEKNTKQAIPFIRPSFDSVFICTTLDKHWEEIPTETVYFGEKHVQIVIVLIWPKQAPTTVEIGSFFFLLQRFFFIAMQTNMKS